jgi:hypothetical protein
MSNYPPNFIIKKYLSDKSAKTDGLEGYTEIKLSLEN